MGKGHATPSFLAAHRQVAHRGSCQVTTGYGRAEPKHRSGSPEESGGTRHPAASTTTIAEPDHIHGVTFASKIFRNREAAETQYNPWLWVQAANRISRNRRDQHVHCPQE